MVAYTRLKINNMKLQVVNSFILYVSSNQFNIL